ncbi:MAG: hypothetical protein HQL51_11705 [Magnetococcales bacterium]|nr:hypothetical protein [Magnetococcales bacterium]
MNKLLAMGVALSLALSGAAWAAGGESPAPIKDPTSASSPANAAQTQKPASQSSVKKIAPGKATGHKKHARKASGHKQGVKQAAQKRAPATQGDQATDGNTTKH